MIKQIIKRDGRVVDFDKSKIAEAIWKAAKAVGGKDKRLSEQLADKVVIELEKIFKDKIPSVEDVQDVVEKVLIEEGHAKTAKAYILYRQERRLIREEKKKILEKDEIDEVDKQFDVNALRVLASRYLNKNEEGKIIESPKEMFERVAVHVALSDVLHDKRIFDKDGNGLKGREIEEELKELEAFYGRGDELELKIGSYKLNKWHFEALLKGYKRLLLGGKIKVGIKKLIEIIKKGELNEYEKNIHEYYELMVNKYFMPNSPTLMNAGNRLGQLSACFVLPIHDSLVSIMKTSSEAALISKAGGGVGINYSALRPRGDTVSSTSGVASGPVSFMEIINTITEVVKQGGKRRGANMAILEIWHPDIEEFITVKQKPGSLENFNLSVGIWGDFLDAIESDSEYSLINPKTGKEVKKVLARKLFDMIAFSAWKSAEPGVLFFDNINKYNILASVKGLIKSTNPCGEQPLYEYESCNLGSINLKRFIKETEDGTEFDWKKYEQVIRLATRFLDNIIDINEYPIPEIEKTTMESRKIGLGIMGLADCLLELEVPYNSEAGYEFMNKLAEALAFFSMDESCEIAKERGSFPLFEKSEYVKGKIPIAGYYELPKHMHNYDWQSLIKKVQSGIRNSLTTTIAPTGSISMIAGCSNGIEPIFGLVFEKHVAIGKFYYTNETFERKLKAIGMYNDAILEKICKNYGCLFGLDEFDEKMKAVFVTALSMHWLDHLLVQAIWQRWIGASISKTINMPNDVSVEDIKLAYLIAYELGLKGVTVYRDGSRHQQVLYISGEEKQRLFNIKPSSYALAFISNRIKNKYTRSEAESCLKRFGFGKEIKDYSIDYHSIDYQKFMQQTQKPKQTEQSSKIIIKDVKEEKHKFDYKLDNKLDHKFDVGVNINIARNNIACNISDIEYNILDNMANNISGDGLCPFCFNSLIFEAGCNRCLSCGWSSCTIA